ncbi:MAG: RagB/SusD family nutrient uptake outer membrane protein, partial [Tannerellaceae bacterium]|nr:RagB/SusD family nutrient uptake outer membrane protein [Tannerellaceae bacterium]
MKILYKYLGLMLISALLLTSCEDQALEHEYYMGESLDQIYSNPDKIAAACIGMYDALQNAEFLGGRALIYVDARGIDINPPTFFGNLSFFSPTSSDGTVTNAWQAAYRTIGECNLFLSGIETAKANNVITGDEYDDYAAQGRFIRGVVYFYVLNFWGQSYVKESSNLGVPLALVPYDGGTAFTEAITVPRSPIADCYTQIIKDFEFAEQHLPTDRGSAYENRALALSYAAQAMLSRVYLYMKDNGNAITYANKVIGKYSLDVSTYSNFLSPESSPEIIFGVAMNMGDNPNTNNALGQHYGRASGRGDITVTASYAALFSDDDVRKTECIEYANESWWCYKYRKASDGWVPIIRYAEILLNKAEALVKSTNTVNADAITLL